MRLWTGRREPKERTERGTTWPQKPQKSQKRRSRFCWNSRRPRRDERKLRRNSLRSYRNSLKLCRNCPEPCWNNPKLYRNSLRRCRNSLKLCRNGHGGAGERRTGEKGSSRRKTGRRGKGLSKGLKSLVFGDRRKSEKLRLLDVGPECRKYLSLPTALAKGRARKDGAADAECWRQMTVALRQRVPRRKAAAGCRSPSRRLASLISVGRGRGGSLGFVVDGEALDDGAALGVEADDFDLGAVLAELDHDLIEGVDRDGVRG